MISHDLLALLALGASQEVLPAQEKSCALHVWASPLIKNDISGIFPGGIAAALETKSYKDALRRGNTTVTHTLLTNDLLMAALKESSIGERFAISPDKFILEPDPNTQRSFVKSPTSSTEGCRYGFTFQMIQFEKSLVWGKRLTLFYNITDRTAGPKPRNVHWYNSEDLKGFDPKLTDAEISVVLKDGVKRVIDDILAKKFPRNQASRR